MQLYRTKNFLYRTYGAGNWEFLSYWQDGWQTCQDPAGEPVTIEEIFLNGTNWWPHSYVSHVINRLI